MIFNDGIAEHKHGVRLASRLSFDDACIRCGA